MLVIEQFWRSRFRPSRIVRVSKRAGIATLAAGMPRGSFRENDILDVKIKVIGY